MARRRRPRTWRRRTTGRWAAVARPRMCLPRTQLLRSAHNEL